MFPVILSIQQNTAISIGQASDQLKQSEPLFNVPILNYFAMNQIQKVCIGQGFSVPVLETYKPADNWCILTPNALKPEHEININCEHGGLIC